MSNIHHDQKQYVFLGLDWRFFFNLYSSSGLLYDYKLGYDVYNIYIFL